jgi:hypothetical protein
MMEDEARPSVSQIRLTLVAWALLIPAVGLTLVAGVRTGEFSLGWAGLLGGACLLGAGWAVLSLKRAGWGFHLAGRKREPVSWWLAIGGTLLLMFLVAMVVRTVVPGG